MTNTANEHNFVLLETLTWTASIAKSTTTEFGLNVFGGYLHASRKTFDNDDQRLAVAFSCSEITQHALQATRVPPQESGQLRVA